MPQPTLRPRFSLLALATGGLLLLSGGCVDSPTEAPAPVLTPPMSSPLTAAFQSPIDRDAFSAAAAPMGASTNSGLDLGGTGWVPLDAGVPEPMHVYFRTSGATRYSINPNVVPGFCDILCVFKVPPYFPGVVGGAGIPGTGWLRYRVRVNGAELIGYPLPDGQMEFLAHVSPGDSIFVQRTGIDGVVTCLTLLICAGYREGWYSLTNQGLHIEALKVLPLQVQPETEVAAPGDSVTFRVATFDENVSRWSWLWRHANGASGPGFSECTGKRECRVPVTDGGYMVVHDARWRVTQPLRQAVSAPVRVQEARVRLECNGQRDSIRITRVDAIQCRVSAQPESGTGQLRLSSWVYRMENLTIAADSTALRTRIWGGQTVRSGVMRVQGIVGTAGITSSDSVRVIVSARSWPETIPPVTERRIKCAAVRFPNCLLLYPPDTLRHLGQTVDYRRSLQLARRAAVVDRGPNLGLAYVGGSESPVKSDSVVIYINGVLDDPDDPFWAGQDACEVEPLRNWVVAHEHKHAELIVNTLREGVANGYSIEAVVRQATIAEMQQYLSQFEKEVVDFLDQSADQRHGLPVWATIPQPCPVFDLFNRN